MDGTKKAEQKSRRPYEEIGAFFNGNEVSCFNKQRPLKNLVRSKVSINITQWKDSSSLRIQKEPEAASAPNTVKIRVPKSTSKTPKLTPSQMKLQQQCTCEDDESVCSETCGYPSHPPENGMNFQIPDDLCEALTNRTHLNSELVYTKLDAPKTICDVCNMTPANAPKGVKAQKILHPDKDVFVLKIGKQTDEPNRTGSIEVELVTPKIPAKPKPALHSCKYIQCDGCGPECCMPCRSCAATKRKKPKRCWC